MAPDQTGYEHVRLSRSFVTISFNVVPVPFSDVYTIQVEQTFQTHVEAGVLVVNPPFVQFTNCTPGFQANFTATVENDGLIQMTDCTLTGAQIDGFTLTPLITYIPVLLPMQTVEVPFSFTYNSPSGSSPQGAQTRQITSSDVLDCIAGSFGPLGGLADTNGNVLRGLAACLAANEQCYTDMTSQQAANTLLALAGVATAAAFFAEPLEVLADTLGAALGCIAGQFLSAAGGSGPTKQGSGAGSGVNFEQIGGCFAPATPVLMADGTVKPIEELQSGDLLRSGPRRAMSPPCERFIA